MQAEKFNVSSLLLLMFCGFLTLLLYLLVIKRREGKSHESIRGIPHPYKVPILGNLWCLSSKTHESFTHIASRLGGRFKLFMGGKEVVVLSSADAVRETLLNEECNFNSRPLFYSFSLPPGGRNISFEPYNKKYLYLRKLAVEVLKTPFCPQLASEQNEEKLAVSLEHVACIGVKKMLESTSEQKVLQSTESSVRLMITSCACLLSTGRELDESLANEIQSFLCELDKVVHVIPFAALADTNPALHYLFWPKIRSLQSIFTKISEFAMTLISNSCDDSIFGQLASNASNHCPEHVSQVELLSIGTQLFGAMVPTTSSTLEWVLLLLANRPDLQDAVRQEIVNNDNIDLKSRNSNVYLNAVIYETLRFITTTPITIPHAPTDNYEKGDVFIPKGTPILVNLWAANHDPEVWKFPGEFEIGNFLTDDRTKLEHSAVESLMSFGVGRRRCVGEKLALSLMYLVMANILRDYKIVPVGNQKIDESQLTRLDVVPKDFKLKFVEA